MEKNNLLQGIKQALTNLPLDEKVDLINELRHEIHELSPFKDEPVDFVKWVKNESVVANDYNPNKVAPPEMELLELSIINDGYTQPIVAWSNEDKNKTEVIDGFHRNRVGKESKIVKKRVHGYLPIVDIRKEQQGKNDRIASTIRHNRARGKHQVDAMSEIVIELKNRNWTNQRISKQLGMDEEEVLRLCQISGIENVFYDADFSSAWEASNEEINYEPITNEISDEYFDKYKIPNEADTRRIYHTYDKWECFLAGFYNNKKEGFTDTQCRAAYVGVLSDQELFASCLEKIITEWKNSCEHYLTNTSMNRIAWLGQAAVCYAYGVPSSYSGAWFDIPEETRDKANQTAHLYLNKWLQANGREEISINEALSIGRQIELY